MNAPAVQNDPAQNFTQSVLGGRQDSQKDAANSNYYNGVMQNIMQTTLAQGMNPYGTGTGKTGLGALDPAIPVLQKGMQTPATTRLGWIEKAMQGYMLGNRVGNQKKAMMDQNTKMAALYADPNLSPQQKAQIALQMRDYKTASGFMAQNTADRANQTNQDRHQKAMSERNTIKTLAEQAYRTGYLDTAKLYRLAGPVQAYLEQVHPDFDIMNAKNKVLAMQQTTRALNSPQQQRLRQAIQSVKGGIPEMQRLSDEFKRMDIIPANRFIMGIRENGIDPLTGQKQWASDIGIKTQGMNPDQVQAAARFKVQVATMRDEIAQVFSGGYAPSEAGFKLADQVLNEFYGGRMTRASLEQLMTNLKIREEALYTDPMNPNTSMTNNNPSSQQDSKSSGGSPEGRIINTASGKKIRQNGQWVPYKGK
jgi:hypothetical protein